MARDGQEGQVRFKKWKERKIGNRLATHHSRGIKHADELPSRAFSDHASQSLPRGSLSTTNRGTRDDMLTIQALSVVALLAILPTCLPYPTIRNTCRPCNNDCDLCEYGAILSPLCGIECRKGPDEDCGHNIGVCGDGMICMCDKCVGCSLDNLKCSVTTPEHPCLSRQARYQNLERSHTFTLV